MFLFFKKKNTKKNSVLFYFVKTRIKKLNYTNLKNIFIGHKIKSKLILNTKYKHIWTLERTPVNQLKSRSNFTTISKSFLKASTFNMFLKSKLNKYSNFQFIIQARATNVFYELIDVKKFKTIYRAGYGNYLLLKDINLFKNKLIFSLPSKKKMFTPLWLLGLLGRNQLQLKKKYISKKIIKNWRPSTKSVRGVAMNPVDHHNGGKSNRKPLFLNKYNKIAKFNK